MYLQVYLHKTVLCAEKMLVNIIKRAREVKALAPSAVLNIFLTDAYLDKGIKEHLDSFCMLDDYDVMAAIKNWTEHPDKILSILCRDIIHRRLLKVKYSGQKFAASEIDEKKEETMNYFKINKEEARYFVFTGQAINNTYNIEEQHIRILFKDGHIKDISVAVNCIF